MPRFVTIHDVAADARVSTATVSRALNEPWRVSPSARERVNASIARLGYTPNLRARLLARGDSGTICFLLSNRPFLHSIHTQMLQGASDRANALGVQIVYAACSYAPDTPPSEIEMPRILAARGLIDGVIVAGTNYPNMLQAIDELELPHVLFGTNLIVPEPESVPGAIYVDDESGGYLAAKHLIELGHKRIRFIGDVSLPWYRRRREGCARALREAGLRDLPSIGKRDATEQTITEYAMGASAVNELCDRDEPFTAIFAAGDMAAVGAMRALAGRGIRVPDDVSVVGFNDEELAQIADPPLTTIRIPTEQIGANCVDLLRDTLENDGVRDPVTLPVELTIRDSTAPSSNL